MTQNKRRVAVVLAGCGFKDGAEIRESVLTLLGLDKAGAEVQCFAPNKELDEVDHLTSKSTGKKRNVLGEAARIARGQIRPLSEARATEFDAVVLPGGFGAAKNLCTFASEGTQSRNDEDLEKFLDGFIEQKKPIGAICIAPVILAKAFQKYGGLKLTLGEYGDAARAVEAMGAQHKVCKVNETLVDADRKVVTTPAYMYSDARLSDIAEGIEKLCRQVVDLCAQN